MIERSSSTNKNTFKKQWSDFSQAAFAPETVFFATITLFCLLTSLLPFDSSTGLLATSISPVLRVLSVVLSGFTVAAFQKNNNSVISKESVLGDGRTVKRRIVALESDVDNLLVLASNKKVDKQEMVRHIESFPRHIKLMKDDLFDLFLSD